VKLTVKGCDISVSWLDRSNFEKGYKIYFDKKLVDTTGPLDGGRGSVTVPLSDLEYGRKYTIDVAAFTDNGQAFGFGQTITTPARVSIEMVLIGPRPTATWKYLPSSEGLANLDGSDWVKVRAVRTSGGPGWDNLVESGNLEPVKTIYTFGMNVDTGINGYTFTVRVFGFGGSCMTESEPLVTKPKPLPVQKPDLAFARSPTACLSDLSACNIHPELKKPFVVFWRVCNFGAKADSSSTKLQQLTPSGSTNKDISTRSLPTGDCVDQKIDFTATEPGNYIWDVFLDFGMDVDESNEFNNKGGYHFYFFRPE
jgi:hypothetical protein